MSLSEQQLAGSLYYPAAGTDLEPVMRFSGEIPTFVYADWNMDQQDVRTAFEHATETSTRLRLSDQWPVEFDISRITTVQAAYRNPRSRRAVSATECSIDLNGVFSTVKVPSEVRAHFRRRSGQVSGLRNPWARSFCFEASTEDGKRVVELYYYSMEGIALYADLYRHGTLAPQILYTRQSGPGFGYGWTCLEEPGGLFEHFLVACEKRPALWCRGGYGDQQLSCSRYDAAANRFIDEPGFGPR